MQRAVVEVVRADSQFREAFDRRLDALLAQQELFCRNADGYLVSVDPARSSTENDERRSKVLEQLEREGFVEQAVEVLKCLSKL